MKSSTVFGHSQMLRKKPPKMYQVLPPENHAGNVEYKRQLVDPSMSRVTGLTTQMSYRLDQGQGIAIYHVGVEDDGTHSMIDEASVKASVQTLERIAESLSATCYVEYIQEDTIFLTSYHKFHSIASVTQIDEFRDNRIHDNIIEEKTNSTNPNHKLVRAKVLVQLNESHIQKENHVLVLGPSSSGKSTLVGLIYSSLMEKAGGANTHQIRTNSGGDMSTSPPGTKGITRERSESIRLELDDGEGFTRIHMLQHMKEMAYGKSLCTARKFIQLDDRKILISDTPALETNLNHVLTHALQCVDYILLMVPIDYISTTTGRKLDTVKLALYRQYLDLAQNEFMNIPVIMLLNKYDNYKLLSNEDKATIDEFINEVKSLMNEKNVKFMKVSCVDGLNLQYLIRYLFNLKKRRQYKKKANKFEFTIVKRQNGYYQGFVSNGSMNLAHDDIFYTQHNNRVKIVSMQQNNLNKINMSFGQFASLDIEPVDYPDYDSSSSSSSGMEIKYLSDEKFALTNLITAKIEKFLGSNNLLFNMREFNLVTKNEKLIATFADGQTDGEQNCLLKVHKKVFLSENKRFFVVFNGVLLGVGQIIAVH